VVIKRELISIADRIFTDTKNEMAINMPHLKMVVGGVRSEHLFAPIPYSRLIYRQFLEISA
jgi:hypothetical protein